MSRQISVIGYADRLSVRGDETINFKVSVSSTEESALEDTSRICRASLFRSINADPNPELRHLPSEVSMDQYFSPLHFEGIHQSCNSGSYAITSLPLSIDLQSVIEVEISFYFLPTRITATLQTLFCWGPLKVCVDENGAVVMLLNGVDIVSSSNWRAYLHHWYHVKATLCTSGASSLNIKRVLLPPAKAKTPKEFNAKAKANTVDFGILGGLVCLAASIDITDPKCYANANEFFNGKLEAPKISVDGNVIVKWDLSSRMTSMTVPSNRGENPTDLALSLINAPTRGVRSSLWDASEFCWRYKPEHYAAIHFHEDDLYDVDWDTSFSFTIPRDMPSGVYVMKIYRDRGDHEDTEAIPFFVCPPRILPRQNKLCYIASTFTYIIYGNHARSDYDEKWKHRSRDWDGYLHNPSEYPNLGLSTYNLHTDGSGICYASHKRPLLNLRPNYITFGCTQRSCSGLRHFPADSHLLSWLHHEHIGYDVITG